MLFTIVLLIYSYYDLSTKVEEAIRKVLMPSLSNTVDASITGFTVPADNGFESHQEIAGNSARSTTTYTVSSQAIDKLQELLLKGQRVAAVQLAMRENLWPHAMIIASCVNKDLWKQVVNCFVRQELGGQVDDTVQSNGRESLRVLYSLLSGQGPNASKDLLYTLRYDNYYNEIK